MEVTASSATTAPPMGSAPAPGAPPAQVQASVSTSVPSAEWTAQLPDNLKGWVESKGFKSIDTMVDSHLNLEKLLGARDQLVKVPKDPDDPNWNDLYTKIGKPASPDDYKLPVPDGDSGEFAKFAQNMFHEAHLSKAQAEKITAKMNEWNQGQQSQTQETYAAQVKTEQDSLKKEWGSAYEQHINVAKAATRQLGMTSEVIDKLEKVMGFSETMKLLNKIGSKVGEDQYLQGQPANQALSPASAQYQIEALMRDPSFVNKYLTGDADAKSRMARLQSYAYPGEITL